MWSETVEHQMSLPYITFRPVNATCWNIEDAKNVMIQLSYLLIVSCSMSAAAVLLVCATVFRKGCRTRGNPVLPT